VASTYSGFDSTEFGADGIMGMGFKEISALNADPFFETLVDQGQLQESVFGFYLAESDSELIIGGGDSSRYSGNITYTNVEKQVRIFRGVLCFCFTADTIQGYWQTSFDTISVNGNVVTVSTQDAVIDTGTTLILGDQESISNIYANIPGSAAMENTDLWTSTLVTMFDRQRSQLIYVR
jgi:cathepsin D